MAGYFVVMSFVFGACVGSFLNVVILRLPAGESLAGRSHCANCRRQLAWWELLPLLSYLFLRGRCRSCRQKISPQYFAVELATALLFAASWLAIRPQNAFDVLLLAKFWLAAAAMVAVFVIDLKFYLILDKVVLLAALAALAINAGLDFYRHGPWLSLSSHFAGGLAAAIVAALPFFLLWYFSRGRWLGFGDVKLMLLLGVILGWPGVFVSLFLAIMLGGVVSVGLLAATRKTLKSQIPFGTFLSLAAVFCLFYGQNLLAWYLRFLGF